MDIINKYHFDRDLFEKLMNDYISGKFTLKDNIIKDKISPPELHHFLDLKNLDETTRKKYISIGKETIQNNKLGYIIVNGGMSTRLGGVVKGVVEVYDNKSFIQIKLEQVKKIGQKYGVSINIFIMNSFATEKATIEYLEKNNFFGLDKKNIHFFNQFIFKRLTAGGDLFTLENKPEQSYYGPGHGDFIYAFDKSNLLEKFMNSGGQHLWFSNVDNLGAIIDESILGYHIEQNNEMTVEVAQKYPGDKGGVPAVVNNKIQLVEGFKIPADFDQNRIGVFNTATYIFKAKGLKNDVKLPFYVVKKKIHDKEVIQFERLTGDLSSFLKCGYIIIDREKRFFPIKTPQDLINQREKLKNIFGTT